MQRIGLGAGGVLAGALMVLAPVAVRAQTAPAGAPDDDPVWAAAKLHFDSQFAAYRAAVAREARDSAAARSRAEAEQAAYLAEVQRVAAETARIQGEARRQDEAYRAALAAYEARYGKSAAAGSSL